MLQKASIQTPQPLMNLSRSRDLPPTHRFLRKALKRHGQPRSITLDAFEPSYTTLRRIGMRNEFNGGPNPVKIRLCKYLNNIVEQDHRRVKFQSRHCWDSSRFGTLALYLPGLS